MKVKLDVNFSTLANIICIKSEIIIHFCGIAIESHLVFATKLPMLPNFPHQSETKDVFFTLMIDSLLSRPIRWVIEGFHMNFEVFILSQE